MATIVVSEEGKTVTIKRSFVGMIANEEEEKLIIHYREIVEVNGEQVSNEVREYTRAYNVWRQHQIGVQIYAMIENDLIISKF